MMKKVFVPILLALSGCNEAPPATNDLAGLPEPSGPPVVQQLERQDQARKGQVLPQPGWTSDRAGGRLNLRDGGGTLLISLDCTARPSHLSVHVPGFSPIGSEDRFALGLGTEPVTLVADLGRGKSGTGVRAEGPVPERLESWLSAAREISALYGTQRSGPHPPPQAQLAASFASACARKPA
jgi:hypothetical protein